MGGLPAANQTRLRGHEFQMGFVAVTALGRDDEFAFVDARPWRYFGWPEQGRRDRLRCKRGWRGRKVWLWVTSWTPEEEAGGVCDAA